MAAPVRLSGIWIVATVFLVLLSLLSFALIRYHRENDRNASVDPTAPAETEAAATPEPSPSVFGTPEPSPTPGNIQSFSKTAILVSGEKILVMASREAAEELIRNVEKHFLSAGNMPDNVVTELSTPIELEDALKDDETVSYDAAFALLTGRNTPIVFISKAMFVEEINAPHSVEFVEDDKLPVGLRIVEVFGRDGIKRNTHEVSYMNGIKLSDTVAESVTVLYPVNSRIRVGTMTFDEDFELGPDFGSYPSEANGLRFVMPVNGKVIKLFGPDGTSFHQGIDISAEKGSDVCASCDGTVVTLLARGAYGLMVEIDCGNGVLIRYAKLATLNVSIGDTVTAGDVIGTVLGDEFGSYLHFELRINGLAYNPLKVLKNISLAD